MSVARAEAPEEIAGRFAPGVRVRLPGERAVLVVDVAVARQDRVHFYLTDPAAPEAIIKRSLTLAEAAAAEVIEEDGEAPAGAVLAGLWGEWILSSARSAEATALASAPLKPYPHQMAAVYGQMLPQPQLRFLLADEPGTGKTIMSGLWLREAQRLGTVGRALVVCPAHLVHKWIADFERFFGGGMQEVTAETVRQHGLSVPGKDLWVASLDLAARNPAVLEALHPEKAGWDAVIFDEAHRLTPSAETYHRVGKQLSAQVPHALFLTATPHRGNEWYFRELLHLVDPDVFPTEVRKPRPEAPGGTLKPGSLHFLRRMKEQLVDYDSRTRLFKERQAANVKVPLNSAEQRLYDAAQGLVQDFFPRSGRQLAAMVYGKRAASSLYALGKTLQRRREQMGTGDALSDDLDLDFDDVEGVEDVHDRVERARSRDARAEKEAIKPLLAEIDRLLSTAADAGTGGMVGRHAVGSREARDAMGSSAGVARGESVSAGIAGVHSARDASGRSAGSDGGGHSAGDAGDVGGSVKANVRRDVGETDDKMAAGGFEPSKWPELMACLADHGVTAGSGEQAVVFTEYADTADWLVAALRRTGFSAESYSGSRSNEERAELQAGFMAGNFQVIVSTDAGNEGIDLQAAHVLVNWDVPWSLVRLEQRMGRIHRIGQQRKVWLYNLIAIGTREGDAHHRLLERLVEAANELGGQMFDSLDAVLERARSGATAAESQQLMQLFYGTAHDDAAGGGAWPTVQEIREARDEHLAEVQRLSTPVDDDAADAARRSDRLDRVNPVIVERFLARVNKAGLLDAERAALAAEGFFYLTATAEVHGWQLPEPLAGAGQRALIATRADVRRQAISDGSTRAGQAIMLGPADAALRALAEGLRERLSAELYQGALLFDRTSAADYTLFAYECEITEGSLADDTHAAESGHRQRPRKSVCSWLIRVDSSGAAAAVAWDTLANLEGHPPAAGAGRRDSVSRIREREATAPGGGRASADGRESIPERVAVGDAAPVPGSLSAVERLSDRLARRPLAAQEADAAATQAVAEAEAECARRAERLGRWERSLTGQLHRLPTDLSSGIADKTERHKRYNQVNAAVTERIRAASASATVIRGEPRRVAWTHVAGTARDQAADEDEGDSGDPDSEAVSMRLVVGELEAAGWTVRDVSRDGKGFDLHAARGAEQRCVEVKGRKGSAASAGISLTGGELLQAAQLGEDYWLYVVEHCADGVGRLYGAWPNPAETFGGRFDDVPLVRLPGSELKAALHLRGDAPQPGAPTGAGHRERAPSGLAIR